MPTPQCDFSSPNEDSIKKRGIKNADVPCFEIDRQQNAWRVEVSATSTAREENEYSQCTLIACIARRAHQLWSQREMSEGGTPSATDLDQAAQRETGSA